MLGLNLKNVIAGKSLVENSFALPSPGFIPYSNFYDPDTIQTKNGELLQIIRIMGFSFDLNEENKVTLRDAVRRAIAKNIRSNEFSIWLHTVRTRRSLDPGGNYQQKFANEAHEAWCKKNYWRDKYVNELYITVVIEGTDLPVNPLNNMGNFLRSLSFNSLKKYHDSKLDNSFKRLTKVVEGLLNDLAEFNPLKLTIVKDEKDIYSEQLQFLSRIMNLVEEDAPLPVKDLSEYLAFRPMAFGNTTFEVSHNNERIFGEILTLKEFPELSPKAIDKFLQLPFELVISEIIDFNSPRKKVKDFENQNYMLEVSGDDDFRKAIKLDVFDEDSGEKILFCERQISVMFLDKDQKKLKMGIKRAVEQLGKLGLMAICEDMLMIDSFWAQLPANFIYLRRKVPALIKEIGAFASLYDFSAGRLTNPWGKALTIFRTVDGTPYFFNFHYHNSGHTAILGYDNSGKTTALNFLISQSMKYNPNIFHFGDDSSKVFMYAANAIYLEDTSPEFSFNPLKLEDSVSNREFLANWLSLLLYNGEPMPAGEEQKIEQIVSANYSLPIESRKLSNIVAAIVNSNQAENFADMTAKLSLWHSNGVYSKYFDNDNDNFKPGQILGFNIKNIQNDQQLCAAIIYYLIHRCTYLVNGQPSIFAFDNAINIWSHQFLMAKMKPWLSYLDKMSAIAIFAGEDRIADPEHELNKFLRSNITTLLVMANNPDKVKTVQIPGFDKKITNILLDMKLINRQFYIQQGNDKILAELNLSGLDEVLKVLSANEQQLQHFQDIISKVGDNANVWLPLYYQTS